MKKIVTILLLLVGSAMGQFSLMTPPKMQFFDNNGKPLAAGQVITSVAGTNTPLATYTDSTGAVANTNPVILDSGGFANIWLGGVQCYRFTVQNSLGVTLYTTDNVCSVSSSVQTVTGFLNPALFPGSTVPLQQQAALTSLGSNWGVMLIPPSMGAGWAYSTCSGYLSTQYIIDSRQGWDVYRCANDNASGQTLGAAYYINPGTVPSINVAQHDMVALLTFIGSGNLNHPIWGATFGAQVNHGTAFDTTATGLELDVNNQNTAQSVITGANRKFGELIINTGTGTNANPGTSAIFIGGNNGGSGWYHALSAQAGNVLTDWLDFSPLSLLVTDSITSSGSPQTVHANVSSSWVIAGSSLSFDSGGSYEVVTIISSDPVGGTITAVFSQNHSANTTGYFLTSKWALNFTNTAFGNNPILLCDLTYSTTAHIAHNCGINIINPSSTEVTPLSWALDGTTHITPVNNKAVYVDGHDGTDTHYVSFDQGQISASDGIFTVSGAPIQGGRVVTLTTNPAASGFLRLAKTDTIAWRNNANGADLALGINGSDRATFNSLLIPTTLQATSGITAAVKGVAGCTTPASIGSVCATAITVTWPSAFADTNYSAGCTPSGVPTNLPGTPYVVGKVAGSITVNYFAITGSAASWATIDCWAIHD